MGALMNGGGGGRAEGGSRRRARAQHYAPMSEINVTPFVDVMLVLLVVFMVTSFVITAVPVDSPKAAAAPTVQPRQNPVTITVTAAGEIYVQSDIVSLIDLPARLKDVAAQIGEEGRVFLKGDQKTSHGAIMAVMGEMRAAGLRKIDIVAESVPSQAPGARP